MAEQPSQLKYIEWPTFTTTVCAVYTKSVFVVTYEEFVPETLCLFWEQLKTATLSLFLVAVFIVALSSVDSALCYILALILRKSP